MRPTHASMLFESERKMDMQIWDSLPKTTNAEEAMHWKLYSACGRDHSFMEGMNALFAVATHYQRLLDGVSSERNTCIVLDSLMIITFRRCLDTLWGS